MHIKKLQKEVADYIEKVDKDFPGEHDADTTFVHLVEELGELSTQIFNKKMGREKFDKELFESGICDCIVQLLQLATVYGVDAEDAINKKKEKVLKAVDGKKN